MHGKQIKDASITKDKLALTSPSSNNDPATKQYVDDSVNNSIFVQDWKASVRLATTGNIDVSSAPATCDSVTMAIGNRIGVKNQSNAAENGIRIFNGVGNPMPRATDADNSSKVTSGMAFYVEEGTINSKTTWRLATASAITLDTTALQFEAFSTFQAPVCTLANKEMAASTTTSNGDQACATVIAGTPANDSYVMVFVNGLGVTIGDGVKTKAAYFSADSGSTAKTLANIASGDRLYWNGSIAGYQLAPTDVIDFVYEV